jgi:hypothetical protein
MKKAFFLMMLLILLAFLLQTGCEERSTSNGQTDWDAVKSIISKNPDIFRLGFFDTQLDSPLYREITQNQADIEEGILLEADSTHSFDYITLTWGDSLRGTFHYSMNGEWREKPITSIALTQAYFERWGDAYDPDLGWLLRQLSGTVINSVGTTRNPSYLTIVSDGVDVTLSEATLLQLIKKDSTLTFGQGKEVTFTVNPSTDTADFFFLHVKEGEAYQKITFTNNGDGTLSAGWTTTSDPDVAKGYHHAIVDVVNRESVTDTLADYDSRAWGVIYRIK